MAAGALLTWFFAPGCAAFESSAQLERQIEDGRREFLEGRPLDAKATFSEALRAAPERIEALHGFARAAARLHLYDEALPAFEKALRLSVRDGQIWEEYVNALASAAVVRRDPALFDLALRKAATALFLFPGRIGVYEGLSNAATELKLRGPYLKLLSDLQEKLPDNPILSAKLTELRLTIAREHDLKEAVAELTEKVSEGLGRLDSNEPRLEDLPPERLYLLFSDYLSIGREGRAEALLPLLERSAEGLRLTHAYRRARVEKMISEAEPAEKLRIVNQALDDFRPKWQRDNQDYWRLLALKFGVLEASARDRRRRGEAPQEGVSAELLQIGMALATADTSNGALWHIRTSRALVDLGVRLDDAIAFARRGIERLRTAEPGMLAPSRGEVESTTARNTAIADLELIEAEARLLGSQWQAAENLLRTLIESRPSAMAHALLARSLKAQGRSEEAYPEFVAALAEGFSSPEAAWRASTQQMAEETASELGFGGRLKADVERRRRQTTQNEEIRIVSERLDQPTPEFELTDTSGRVWSSTALRGSVVVLNFWATWCGPCLKEFPSFAKLIKSYSNRPDIVFLAVSIDESTAEIEPFLAEKGYTFTAVYDNGAAADFQVEEIPATILIDRQGRVQYRTVGFPGEKRYLREMKLRIDVLAEE